MDLISIIQNTLLLGVAFFTLVIGISYLLSKRSKSKRNPKNAGNIDREQIRKYNLAYMESRQRNAQTNKSREVYPMQRTPSSASSSKKSDHNIKHAVPRNVDRERTERRENPKTFSGDKFRERTKYSTKPRLKIINSNIDSSNQSHTTEGSNYYDSQRQNYVSRGFYR